MDPDGTYFGVTRDATGARRRRDSQGAPPSREARALSRDRRVFSGQRVVREGRTRHRRGNTRERRGAGGDERGGGGGGAGVRRGVGGGADTDADADAFAFAHTSQASACYSPAHSTNDSRGPARRFRRRVAPRGGGRPPAELVSIYHEDSGVPAAVITLGAMKGLAPYMRGAWRRRCGAGSSRGGGPPRAPAPAANARRRREEGRGRARARPSRAARRSLFFGKGAAGKLASFWPARRIRGGGRGACRPPRDRRVGRERAVVAEARREASAAKDRRRALAPCARSVRRAAGHERIHAEGRRRRLVVRAAGLVAVVARMRGGGAGSR